MLELVKGKMYRQKVNSQQGYEDWEYTGITIEVPNNELWYAFKNDLGCCYFAKKDLENFVEIKM